MNGAQDLGGMMGFGPVRAEPDEPIFHAAWERRALSLTLAAGMLGRWTGDKSRHTRESLDPAFYLSRSYYEIWIAALCRLLAEIGLVRPDELAAGLAIDPVRNEKPAPDVPTALRILAAGTPYDRPASAPAKFTVGDAVRTKVMHPASHTRLPRYARGKRGVIESVRGCFVFPDTNAHGQGENPNWCYTVCFAAPELWGPDGDPNGTVCIDAWEPYLEPA
jgi:nitrile hydratase